MTGIERGADAAGGAGGASPLGTSGGSEGDRRARGRGVLRPDVRGPTAPNPAYTRYHPRWYRRRMPIFWWLGQSAYRKFVARELTSVAVAYAVLLLLAWAWTVSRGPEAYAAFLSWLARPWAIALHAFAFLALLFHTVTWLGLAPKAIALKLAGRRLPDRAVVAGHYLLWALASLAVVWALVWGI